MLEEVNRSEASSQENLYPYSQSVQPQGLAAATNNFGTNIPQKPLGAPDLIDQGNSNPLPQPTHSQVQRVEPAVVQTPAGNHSKPFKSFSSNQRSILENVYKDDKYPSDTRIEQLAQELDVNFNNVLYWFQNRRSKGPSKKNKKN
jgi:hypothetical protein